MTIVYIVWFVISLTTAIRVASKSGGHPIASAAFLMAALPGLVVPPGLVARGIAS